MLDRAMNSFIPYILDEDPSLKNIYSGFVYYPNTVSFGTNTRIGAPALFGAYEYTPEGINKKNDTPIRIKHNESLLLMPRLFSEANFNVTVTDPPYPNYAESNDLSIYKPYPDINVLITDNVYTNYWLEDHNLDFPSTGETLKRNTLWYSIFKIIPLVFRDPIYMEGDWCAPISTQDLITLLKGYAVLDYLPRLTSISNENKNTFLLMVNNATHESAALQAPDYTPALEVSNTGTSPFRNEPGYHVNIAALKRLGEWINYLKAQGVYDNTRIILVSDHGNRKNFVGRLRPGIPVNLDAVNPLLMVKDFNSQGEIKADETFMTNADVPLLAMKNQIDKPHNPFTGKMLTDEAKKEKLYIAFSGSLGLGDPQLSQFSLNPSEDYYVHDSIFKPENWSKVK
jgi:hypothetical protein